MQIDINYDNGLSDIANNIENNFADIIGQGAQTVCESAKSLCHVDTGRLQSSINVQPGGNTAVISADTEYAVFVEFGTSKMAAQPYLVPALLSNTQAILSADNDESIQDGHIQIDIWAEIPKECSDLAAEVNEVMTKDSWVREMSMDVPENDKKIYHKTMRFQKYFTL